MDWQLAISRNREALLRIIAALFALAGLAEGRAEDVLPRHIYRAILRVLRPAESAVRRLIIIAARGLVLAPYCARPFPAKIVSGSGQARLPAFRLIDPLKRFSAFAEVAEDSRVEDAGYDDVDEDGMCDNACGRGVLPRISVPGHFDPLFTVAPVPSSADPINAQRLGLRLAALKRALENLPKQARRLARWHARRPLALQRHKPMRISPFRPGSPPGHRQRHIHEVHGVLRECHLLMLDTLAAPDTS
jgi:hypothetical protein